MFSSKTDSIEYLDTILYLPRELQQNNLLSLRAPFNVYTKNITCTGSKTTPCNIELLNNASNYYVTGLQNVFDKILSEEVCVSSTSSGSTKKWNLFWNPAKVLSDLDTKKNTISDANICSH